MAIYVWMILIQFYYFSNNPWTILIFQQKNVSIEPNSGIVP